MMNKIEQMIKDSHENRTREDDKDIELNIEKLFRKYPKGKIYLNLGDDLCKIVPTFGLGLACIIIENGKGLEPIPFRCLSEKRWLNKIKELFEEEVEDE